MANKKNSLIRLATGKKKKTAVAKTPQVEVKKKTTPEEDRDIKAKETVEKLLEGVSLIPKENEDSFELDVEAKKPVGEEWLQEQVALLGSENENLRIELANAKDNYAKLFAQTQESRGNSSNSLMQETITQNVLILFNELQNNLLGNNAEKTVWTTVNIPHLLKKMLLMFPFTAEIKKF